MEELTWKEQKHIAMDNYVNLLRIKAEEKAENRELERQIKIAEIKLSIFSVDCAEIAALF